MKERLPYWSGLLICLRVLRVAVQMALFEFGTLAHVLALVYCVVSKKTDDSIDIYLWVILGATGAVHLLAYDTRSYVVACTEEKHLIAWACQQPYDAPPCLCLPLDAKPTELILQDKHCVVAVEDRVLLVSLAAGKVVKTLTVAGRGAVTCVKWSKATGVLCCGFAAGTIALWDTATILETSSPSSSMPEPLW
jgi:WD40 repeat protein